MADLGISMFFWKFTATAWIFLVLVGCDSTDRSVEYCASARIENPAGVFPDGAYESIQDWMLENAGLEVKLSKDRNQLVVTVSDSSEDKASDKAKQLDLVIERFVAYHNRNVLNEIETPSDPDTILEILSRKIYVAVGVGTEVEQRQGAK